MICSCVTVLVPTGERLTRSCLKETVTAVRSQASIGILLCLCMYAVCTFNSCSLSEKSARENSTPEVNLGGSRKFECLRNSGCIPTCYGMVHANIVLKSANESM